MFVVDEGGEAIRSANLVQNGCGMQIERNI